MKRLLIILFSILISSCAGQGVKLDVETANDKCGMKKVKFSTDYQVEELVIGRTVEGGGEGPAGGSEGCGGGYTVSLGKGTTKDAELGVITELLKMVQAMLPHVPAPDNQ